MKISVIGTGYLGITHAVCMAQLGHDVIGFDVNVERVAAQNAGNPTVFEPELTDMLVENLASKRISFTTSELDLSEAEIHFICVGTPQSQDSPAADLSQLNAAVKMLCKVAAPNSVIAGKSTVPSGTVKMIEQTLLAEMRGDISVVWNPEFLRESHAVFDTLSPSRLVIGARNPNSAKKVEAVYVDLISRDIPLIHTDPESAELVKLAANSFLALKISFINGFSQLCTASGANPNTVAQAIGLDERIGPHFLKPGLGFGGACLPKDLHSTAKIAHDSGAMGLSSLLGAADVINLEMREKAFNKIVRAASDLQQKTVGVLGLTFKPGTDDIRESPSIDVVKRLLDAGYSVRAHDPLVTHPPLDHPNFTLSRSPEELIDEVSVVVLMTEWPIYTTRLPTVDVKSKHILDFRYALNASTWNEKGWTYESFSIRTF